MDRALGQPDQPLRIQREVKEALEELDLDLTRIEDQEPGSGNLETVVWEDWLHTFPLDSLRNFKLRSIWLRNPLPLRNVQTENLERIPSQRTG